MPSNWSPKPVDLHNLESFARAFTAKRCELKMMFALIVDLGQVDVARSLKLLYGVHRSSTLISRVERMDLSLNNFLQIYPVLLQWLKDTEFDKSRDAIIRAALDTTEGTVPSSPLESLPASTLGPIFRKRRLRTVLSSEAKKVLEDAFIADAHPPTTVLKHLASKLNLDTHVVRVWFYNRRSRRCRPKMVKIN
ncbi:POU domain transcription factor, class 2 [Paragonimus westermani]|uniref:POU domain transcription factor, class 2 n=1 Tax=Paragonimus westermani TaxID=34504 RepID=A0A5J4NLF6_9TREM|nr:POU domain transcription factor, class 2 [Paragonimus westermani]